LTVPKK